MGTRILQACPDTPLLRVKGHGSPYGQLTETQPSHRVAAGVPCPYTDREYKPSVWCLNSNPCSAVDLQSVLLRISKFYHSEERDNRYPLNSSEIKVTSCWGRGSTCCPSNYTLLETSVSNTKGISPLALIGGQPQVELH